MPKHLLIVESPTKARTLSRFLGAEYEVLSSYGHIRDLPEKKLGVDVEHDFAPQYVVPKKARERVTELKKAVKSATTTVLATDEDREGEAIAWHLARALNLDETTAERIVFHEITKRAIAEALEHPRTIDMHLVDAQQGRRVLDRLVGYELSPFLWRKVARGLSAGRVQSVTVRLIVDREREIERFKPEEYWTITALLATQRKTKEQIEAQLFARAGEAIPKLGIKSKDQADAIVKELDGVSYQVGTIEQKEVRRNPAPPFITSSLVQEASRRLRFPSRLTMRVAQELYERGLITYHRTDSVNLADIFLAGAKTFVTKEFGAHYHQFRKYKTKSRLAQEAHEAIRPTDVALTALDGKSSEQLKKLYDLIWRRAVASQMKEARLQSTAVMINAGPVYTFRATGSTLTFDGFLRVWPVKTEETLLPQLREKETLELMELTPGQHFTEPPPRYSEATLVKTLEAHGIGRPSTYAPTISTIQDRQYVLKERGYFHPTDLGKTVTDLMVEHFPQIIDIDFTAKMEEDLDRIAEGKTAWVPVIRTFYTPFKENLARKYTEVKKRETPVETTDETCPECGKALVIRTGRFGKFHACTGFPECKYTRTFVTSLGIACPQCNEGELVERKTKKGRRVFWGCSRYPQCAYATWTKPRRETSPASAIAQTQPAP
ncbi:MAG: type I DNA topoisomerase [bacterium]|nr:type I DNA topoisomerase [bacterium]MDZ4296606.1 type I DNA topoisomerase [Patescibacteria group bacterium]